MNSSMGGRQTLGRRVLRPISVFFLVATLITLAVYYLLSRGWVADQAGLQVSTLETSLVLSLESMSQLSRMQRVVTAIGAERNVQSVIVIAGDPPEVLLANNHLFRGKQAHALPPGTLGPQALEVIRSGRSTRVRDSSTEPGIIESIATAHLTDASVEGLRPVEAFVIIRMRTGDIQRQVLKQLLLSFAILMALMTGVIFFVWRTIASRITQPLSGLVGQLKEFPLPQVLEAGTADQTEVGLLVDAFNESLRKLRIQERFQSEILNHAGAAIIATTAEGVITLFNPEAERLLGYASGEMVGRLTPGVFHDPQEVAERAVSLSTELGQAVEPGFEVFVAFARRGRTETREWTYIRKDGTRVPVLLSVSALRDGKGQLTGFLGVARDLSDIKERDRVLRTQLDLIARRENLLQEVHHRVKNNLQIVSSLLSLQMRDQPRPEVAEQLRIAHARINSISTLHELIYDAHDLESVRLDDLINKMSDCLADIFSAEAKDIRISSEVDERILVPQSKAGPVALIINELATNSIKHAFTGMKNGHIRITARCEPPAGGEEGMLVVVEVADDGVGAGAPKAVNSSSGLGSLIVERLAKQIRATIEHVAQDKGFCTRVSFRI